MQCPVDGAQLVMTERAGVEIDYCPQCRGVWLDRGELDKIIDRSAAQSTPKQPQRPYDDRGYSSGYYKPKYKKRKSILSEIFDFD
jgi:Zn-finger nucleic acid-binding protein